MSWACTGAPCVQRPGGNEVQRFQRGLTFSNVVACICLFVVLGGDSFAKSTTKKAVKLITGKEVKNRTLTASDVKKSSLTGTEVKDKSLTGADVKDGSLTGVDINGSVLQPGTPAGGDLTGTFPNPKISSSLFDQAAGTPSLRTLGTGAAQAAAGNDPRLSDARTPTGAAGGALNGTFPNPGLAAGSVGSAQLKPPLALSTDSTDSPLAVTSTGAGGNPVISALASGATATRPAIRGEVKTQFANTTATAVHGVSSGTGGYAGVFQATNPAGNGPALVATAAGTGNGITANADNTGDGIETTADGTGSGLYSWVPSFGQGRAARLINYNTGNTNPVLTAEQHSNGSIAVFKAGNPGTVNVARINSAGLGFFNGGTQMGGADLAEIVPTCGSAVKPGQVVEIDADDPDCFRPSTTANTARVAGVISTAPGVTLNAPNGAQKEDERPALALAGRVPVDVTGPVRIGDLLVASSVPGRAMRAPAEPAVGTVIGKALESASGGRATIKMLVVNR